VRLVSSELLATCKTAVRITELIALVQTSAAGVRHFLRSFSLQFCPRLSWKLLLGRTTAHELQRKQWIWYKFIEFFLGLSGSRRLLSAATRRCFLPVFRCNLHAERKGLNFKGLVLVELSNGACRNVAFFFWQQKKHLLWSQNGFKCCRGWCKAPSCSNLCDTNEVWKKL